MPEFGIARQLANQQLLVSPEKPSAYSFTFPLAGASEASAFLRMDGNALGVTRITGVFIDNSQNTLGFTLTVADTGQQIYVPEQSQCVFPILNIRGDTARFVGESAGAVDVNVLFLNFEPAPFIWSVVPAGTSGTVTVTGAVTANPPRGTWTDASGTITTGGASQTVFAANASRLALLIEVPYDSTDAVWFNFGGAANKTTSFQVTPGGYLPVTYAQSTQSVTAYSDTTGAKFIAKQLA